MSQNTRRVLDYSTATAADFDAAAQRHANAFWLWLIGAAVVWYFARWWAAIPAVLAAWAVASSVGATIMARRLRAGTYKLPNPNNGAPDGDARNWDRSNELPSDSGS
jgi:MFS superfamily sulfate permease-like transporter